MNTLRFYTPDGGSEDGGNGGESGGSKRDSQGRLDVSNEGPHDPGDTPLENMEELPGGAIHGHVIDDDKGTSGDSE